MSVTDLAKKTAVRRQGWVGVAFGENLLQASVTRPSPTGSLDVVQETSVAMQSGGDEQPVSPAWGAAAQTLVKQLGSPGQPVVTAIGCEDVLCQTLTLPATDEKELRQMLELQIDGLTPLPSEDVVYSFEPVGKSEGGTKVLLAIGRKSAINDRVRALEEAGLAPEIVSVDALAEFRALMERGAVAKDDRLNALMVVEQRAVRIIIHVGGVPMLVRYLGLGEKSVDTAEGRAEIRTELHRTLLSVQSSSPVLEVGQLALLTYRDELKPSLQTLVSEWGHGAHIIANGSVPGPAVSLCVECASSETPLNLLPDEWRQRRRAAARRKWMVRAGIAAGVLYVIAAALFLTLVAVRRSQTASVLKDIAGLKPSYDAARALNSELAMMRRQLDTKYSALESLREVSVQMPQGVKLNTFVFKKDNSVTLRGQAPTSATAVDFISRLEHSDLFSNVKTITVRTEPSGLTRFDVLCTLKSAPATTP
jgi:Tfp pilus assembly protein PilN